MTRLPSLARAVVSVLAVGAVAALTVTGCDASSVARPSTEAARVGDQTISFSQVQDDLAAEEKAGVTGVKGVSEGTLAQSGVALALTNRIVYLLLGDELARRGITVTSAERQASRTALCTATDQTTGQSTPPTATTCPKLASYPKAYVDFQLDLDARARALLDAVAPGSSDYAKLARQRYDQIAAQSPDALERICVTAAALPDQASVDRVKAQAEAGGDFQQLVTAESGQLDQQQCAAQSQFAGTAIADAVTVPIGTVLGPIVDQQTSRLIVVRVDTRETVTFDEVKDALVQDIASSDSPVGRVASRIRSKAVVHVDPRYGHWDAKRVSVVSPTPPKGVVTASPSSTVPAPGGG